MSGEITVGMVKLSDPDWRKAKRRSRKLVAKRITKRGGGRKEIEIALRKCVRGKAW